MAETVIRNTSAPRTSEDAGTSGWMVAVIILALVLLFLFLGLPALRNTAAPGASDLNVSVPESVDLNVSPGAGGSGGAQ